MLSAGFEYKDFQSILNLLSAFELLYMSGLQILILQPSDNISDGTAEQRNGERAEREMERETSIESIFTSRKGSHLDPIKVATKAVSR